MIYSPSIYYSSSTGERAEYITEDEKDKFDMFKLNNLSLRFVFLFLHTFFLEGEGGGGGALTIFKSTFRGVMPFSVFL